MDLELRGRRALVTGSSGGMGTEIARRMAAEGAAVVVHGRSADGAENVAAGIRRAGGEAVAAAGDLATDEGAEAVGEAIEEAYGSLDILVNNVGSYSARPWDETDLTGWREILEGNLLSAVRMCRRFVPGMRERRWGRLIQVASVSAIIAPPPLVAYAAAKAGVVNLTVALAKTLAGTGITSNAVSPGPVETESWRNFTAEVGDVMDLGADSPEELKERLLEGPMANPSGRVGRPADIATIVALLLAATGALSAVAYGDGTWVAAGRDDDGALAMVSADGRAWREVGGFPSSLTRGSSVTWGDGRFVALAFDAAEAITAILASRDGRSWNRVDETNLLDARVVHGDGSFVIHGSSVGAVLVSTDGIEWHPREVPEVTRIDDLTHGPDGWVGTGMFDVWFGEEPGRVRHYTLTSDDARGWTVEERATGSFLLHLASGAGMLVGLSQDRALLRSADGIEWKHTAEVEILLDLARGDGLFVAVGRTIRTSPHGRDWTLRAAFGSRPP